MIIIARIADGYIKISKFVEENPKTFSVEIINSGIPFANVDYSSRIKKKDCLYKGELLPITYLISEWNKLKTLESEEKEEISKKYKARIETIRNKIASSANY